jgi:hypothetical protein
VQTAVIKRYTANEQIMVILLNGSMNSGKSTIADAIARRCERCAHVEVDLLREFIRWMPIDESIPINLANAVAVTKTFVRHGIRTIISYPLSKHDFSYLTSELEELNVPVIAITLNPGLHRAITNRGSRALGAEEVKRIHYMYESGLASPGFGVEIDNSSQTIEETVQKVLDIAEWKAV